MDAKAYHWKPQPNCAPEKVMDVEAYLRDMHPNRAPAANDIGFCFTPVDLPERSPTIFIQSITLAAGKASVRPDGVKTNHWTFYLQLDAPHPWKTVVVNTQAKNMWSRTSMYAGTNVQVLCSEMNFNMRRPGALADAPKLMRLATRPHLTLHNFVDMMFHYGYNRYDFTPQGRGNRFWVWAVLEMLQAEKMITDSTQYLMALHALRHVWVRTGPGYMPLEEHIVSGLFYYATRHAGH